MNRKFEKLLLSRIPLILGLLFLITLALRLLYFQTITFSYDQVRDAFEALSILHGDPLKILGPSTDFRGLFHGPAYWYLIAPILYITNGNIVGVRIFLLLISSLTVFFIYDLTKSLFKNRLVGLLAVLLFAVSFEATQYGRWLSNPAPAILTITASFWSIKKLAEGKSWGLLSLAFFYGLSIQFQFFLVYESVIFVIAWIILNGKFILPKVSLKTYALSILIFLATVSTYILAEIKFSFRGLHALFSLAGDSQFGGDFMTMLISYINTTVNVFYLNLWGLNLFLAGILTIFTFLFLSYLIKKGTFKKELLFLSTWILSPLLLELFNKTNAHFTTIGSSIGILILSAYLLFTLIKSKSFAWVGWVLILFLVIGNLNLIINKNKDGEVLFKVQDKMLLQDELRSIDWIYQKADKKPFRLNTITVPLYVNGTWAYLFLHYGQPKYGYMPYWWGEPQENVLGAEVKFSDKKDSKVEFLIIEPGSGIDNVFARTIRKLEDQRSKVVESAAFGSFTVEQREVINENTYTHNDVLYDLSDKNTRAK